MVFLFYFSDVNRSNSSVTSGTNFDFVVENNSDKFFFLLIPNISINRFKGTDVGDLHIT